MKNPTASKIHGLSQAKPGGNTKPPGLLHQHYRWCLTIPYKEISASLLSQHFKSIGCKKFTFQAETGKTETEYEHWQCEVSLETKQYFHSFQNLLGISKAHIEPTKDYFAAKNYCSKSDTRLEGPYTEKSVFLKIIEELRPWQEKLRDELILEPNDRKIIWYYDPKGGSGKTQFSKYMGIKYKAAVFNNGKTSDIAYALDPLTPIVIFNLPRTLEGKVNYTGMEAIKDGLIFSAKYESCTKIFNCPHLVVFANFLPNITSMSLDRWDIRDSYGNEITIDSIINKDYDKGCTLEE